MAVWGLVLALPVAAAEPLREWQRHELERSGRVDAEVIAALARDGRARIITLLEVRAGDGGVLRSFRSPAARAALRRQGEGVLEALARRSFELSHRYRAIASLAGAADAGGVLALLGHPAVTQIGLDRVNEYGLEEALPLAGVQQVRRKGKHGKGVWLAILDSGVDTDHKDLKKAIKAQECFCSPGCCPDGSARQSGKGSAEDDVGHGTLVAGTVVSRGKQAPRGVASKAKLLAMKVGDPIGPKDSDVLAALDWLLTEMPEVGVLNMSFGGGRPFKGNCDKKGATNKAYAAAIDALRASGTLAFTSSGNGARSSKMGSPACIKNVISVGAVYDEDIGPALWGTCVDLTSEPNQLVCFTDRGPKTDLVAPGALITGPALGGGAITSAGTSFSSPIAAGCAVLLRKKYSAATPDEIEAALESSASRVSDPDNGRSYPALDCEAAFAVLGAG